MAKQKKQAKQKLSKKDRLLNYLSTGRKVTAEQARARCGTGNLRSTICDLRKEGYEIETVPVSKKSSRMAYVMYND